MKKNFKIYIGIFVFFAIFGLSASILLSEVSAADVKFTPQVSIGEDFTAGEEIDVQPTTIGKYIRTIYTYAISVVGILAAVVIMFYGFSWVISAGNQEKISDAKAKIAGALSGLVLVLFAYALFNFINPDLVNLKSIDPKYMESESFCRWEITPISGWLVADYKTAATITCPENKIESDGAECGTLDPIYEIDFNNKFDFKNVYVDKTLINEYFKILCCCTEEKTETPAETTNNTP